jgi:hypothetical protein
MIAATAALVLSLIMFLLSVGLYSAADRLGSATLMVKHTMEIYGLISDVDAQGFKWHSISF